jgi:hypothetical protein
VGGRRREGTGGREVAEGRRREGTCCREPAVDRRREGGGGREAAGGKQYDTKNISLDIRRLHGPHLTMIIPDICYILPTRIHMFYIYRTLKCYIFIIHST